MSEPAVLEAAMTAWTWAGADCHLDRGELAQGIVGMVKLPDIGRVEVVLDTDCADSAWAMLRRWKSASESLRLCAVVPLAAMGQAHEALRDLRCDLQPWWVQGDGVVVFGSVERA